VDGSVPTARPSSRTVRSSSRREVTEDGAVGGT
jgi:hypothetical protein